MARKKSDASAPRTRVKGDPAANLARYMGRCDPKNGGLDVISDAVKQIKDFKVVSAFANAFKSEAARRAGEQLEDQVNLLAAAGVSEETIDTIREQIGGE